MLIQPIAKILAQIEADKSIVPVELYAQAKAKDPPNDAFANFMKLYASHSRVGTLIKESHTGKLIQSWESAISNSNTKPELVDMSPAVSSFMAVKDEEELVRLTLVQLTIYLSMFFVAESNTYCSKSYFSPSCASHSCKAGDNIGQGSRNCA
jgi:nucleosome binding factor SPN SPT16 subunit